MLGMPTPRASRRDLLECPQTVFHTLPQECPKSQMMNLLVFGAGMFEVVYRYFGESPQHNVLPVLLKPTPCARRICLRHGQHARWPCWTCPSHKAFRVSGFGFRNSGLGFRVSGFRV